MTTRFVVRPSTGRGARDLLFRVLASRGAFSQRDYSFETADGEERARLTLHFSRANELVDVGTGRRVTLTREGAVTPRFEAWRATEDGERGELVAAIDYGFVTGAMDLSRPDGTRRRLEQVGLLLPTVRLVEPDGHVALEMEAERIHGKSMDVTLRPVQGRWTEDDLLTVAALVVHARASLSVLFSAAIGAAVLAPQGGGKSKSGS